MELKDEPIKGTVGAAFRRVVRVMGKGEERVGVSRGRAGLVMADAGCDLRGLVTVRRAAEKPGMRIGVVGFNGLIIPNRNI